MSTAAARCFITIWADTLAATAAVFQIVINFPKIDHPRNWVVFPKKKIVWFWMGFGLYIVI